MHQQLVSIVIPAHNAAATLDETLRSVRAQSHRALEIIVVNDGSTDDTGSIAQHHAAADERVRIITQRNAGLAAARNSGWHDATSELIAFIDADDLWAVSKIERQLDELVARGPNVGLVYCWYARINLDSHIESLWEGVRFQGNVLQEILGGNFIGNGSSALVRKDALVAANGFDSGLRSSGAEGCEDWLAYCRIAERYEFAVVPEHLIGYRTYASNMSSNRPQMLRSWILVQDILLGRQPDHGDQLKRGVRTYGAWLVQNAVSVRNFRQIPQIIATLFRRYPLIAVLVATVDVPADFARKIARRATTAARRRVQSSDVQGQGRFDIGTVDR